MKSYCIKQKKQTECVPGTEQYVKTKNGRNATLQLHAALSVSFKNGLYHWML